VERDSQKAAVRYFNANEEDEGRTRHMATFRQTCKHRSMRFWTIWMSFAKTRCISGTVSSGGEPPEPLGMLAGEVQRPFLVLPLAPERGACPRPPFELPICTFEAPATVLAFTFRLPTLPQVSPSRSAITGSTPPRGLFPTQPGLKLVPFVLRVPPSAGTRHWLLD
jgi:hypothetical protein